MSWPCVNFESSLCRRHAYFSVIFNAFLKQLATYPLSHGSIVPTIIVPRAYIHRVARSASYKLPSHAFYPIVSIILSRSLRHPGCHCCVQPLSTFFIPLCFNIVRGDYPVLTNEDEFSFLARAIDLSDTISSSFTILSVS